ncbi:hypothetical protein [Hydrogenophaga sp. 5NK40-0174]|uniref:hypothetical protein n=1 Tax=Hydrogenophaga sp. 5NK40-0174 TaxID=3127649 RepID=UPI0031081210
MKSHALFVLTWGLVLATSAQAETYNCTAHPKFSEGRQFSATVEVSRRGSTAEGRLVSLQLSEPWPLPASCDNPSRQKSLTGRADRGEITLGPKGARGCSFVLYFPATSNEPALLSPRKSAKVFGEAPYLASCLPR